MSAPTIEKSPVTDGLNTADMLTIDRAFHDKNILSELSKQFDPDLIKDVRELTHNNRYSSINDALPSALDGSGVEIVGARMSMVHTMVPGGTAEDLELLMAEPEIPHGEPRPYSAHESDVVLAALRKAAHIPGHRREATLLLAEHSPSKLERTSRQIALTIGSTYLAARNPRLGRYRGRHREGQQSTVFQRAMHGALINNRNHIGRHRR